ncbi:MAG: type II secretion system F family protein [Candidatus Woesearchaeota archaeon]
MKISELFFKKISGYFPKLQTSLKNARYKDNYIDYTKKAFISAIFVSLMIFFFISTMLLIFESSILFAIPFLIIFFLFSFYFLMNKPSFDILNAEKQIDSEIVSAIRFLSLELKSERSLYNSINNISKNFVIIGIYFDEIVNEIKLGNTMEKALSEAVETCPSAHLRSVYWQLLNSLQTGTDITKSLEVLLNDIVEEQKIQIEEYGRELNALSLFYMMIAIIIPTIGFTILLAVLTFLGITVALPLLLTVWMLLTLVQFFFLKFTANRRPSVEAH